MLELGEYTREEEEGRSKDRRRSVDVIRGEEEEERMLGVEG
jgi:hypothetical protein